MVMNIAQQNICERNSRRARDPPAEFVGIADNDHIAFDKCDPLRAIVEHHGSHVKLVIAVNAVRRHAPHIVASHIDRLFGRHVRLRIPGLYLSG